MKQMKYMKKRDALVTAVQLNLETEGFTYEKWGDLQRCKPGDWLVDNLGETYTVDSVTFEETYTPVSPGRYAKKAPVWAEVAAEGCGVSLHAGEMAGPASVRAAVEVCGATRIGHGTSAPQDPAVMALLAERDVHVELCPGSNVRTGAVADLEE